MKKKILALLLTLCLLSSAIIPAALAVDGDTTEDATADNCPYCEDTIADDGAVIHAEGCNAAYAYDGAADVGKYVKLNDYYADSAVFVHDGSNDLNLDDVLVYDYIEFEEGLIFQIADWYWDSETTALWYKVTVYEGSLPDDDIMPAEPWILQNYTDNGDEDTLVPAEVELPDDGGDTPVDTTLSETINGVSVTVQGKMPKGVGLVLGAVSGYNAVFAADIKLIKDGAEWQPGSINEVVAVVLDAATMGLTEGQVVTLTHIHEGVSTDYTYVVIDGQLVFYTDKFSVYIVSTTSSKNGTKVTGTQTKPYEMTVGETLIFYTNTSTRYRGEWQVTDTENTISYTVHDDGTYSSYQRYAPWITVNAVDATVSENVVLYYVSQSGSETFYIKVAAPEEFYVDDRVPETGCLVPAGLSGEGISYTWSRSDGQAIQSTALNDDGSINISLDRGGVTNSRLYSPITYTVTAKNADGDVIGTAEYEVFYGNEILNPSFENPDVDDSQTNVYLYNGYPGLYWKTTAPGTTSSQLTQDIEIINEGSGASGSYGVENAAEGSQFAEVNAENFGALYQDMLTTPGATLTWHFSHAARTTSNSVNTLYVVVAATEDAQSIVSKQNIYDLLAAAKSDAGSAAAIPSSGEGFSFTYNGGSITIWRHVAEAPGRNESPWQNISGTYDVPESQYLTRLFFASEITSMSNSGTGSASTLGNLIDYAYAGETMSYKIEYYKDGALVSNDTQTGNGTVYTTVGLDSLQSYLNAGYVLTSAKIGLEDGDKDYPGNVNDGLFVTDYGESGNNDYGVVLKVYFSKRAVTVTKIIVIEGWENLSDDERNAIVNGGLTAQFALKSGTETKYTASLTIVGVSSTGALVTMGEFLDGSGSAPTTGSYTVEETSAPRIPGYLLSSTEYNKTSVQITNSNYTDSVTCTNTYERNAGSIAVSKTVSVAPGSSGPDEDTVSDFRFDIPLADGSYSYVITDAEGTSVSNGKLTASNGSGVNFTLKDGQTITISGVPVGIYTVTETEYADYKTDVLSRSVTVEKDGAGTAEFTNVYPRNKGGLTVIKKVETAVGYTAPDGDEFEFTVNLPVGEYAYEKSDGTSGTLKNTAGTVTFTLEKDESITLEDVPEGEYTVRETERSEYLNDPDSPKTVEITAGEIAEVTFTNTYPRPKGSLSVVKTVTGDQAPANDEFGFNVNLPSGSYSYTLGGTGGTLTSVNNSASFTLKHGQTITISDVPVGSYTVTEEAKDHYTPDHASKSVTVVENSTAQVSFTNTYSKPVGNITITKRLGDTGADVPQNQIFTFTVTGSNVTLENGDVYSGYAVSGNKLTVTVTGAGSVTVEGLPVGTYIVSENTYGDYDQYVGSAAATSGVVGVQKDGTATIVFTNTYKRADLTVSKTVDKAYAEDSLPNESFSFSFGINTSSSYDYVITKANGGTQKGEVSDGDVFQLAAGDEIVIKNIPVKSGYSVTEIADADYTTKVDGKAGLTAQGMMDVDGASHVFANTYRRHLGSLTINKVVEGEGASSTDSFVFTVTGPTGFKTTQVIIIGGGSVTLKDVPVGTYTVTEETWSWRYTSSGVGSATISLDDLTAEVTITNTYSNDNWLGSETGAVNEFDAN